MPSEIIGIDTRKLRLHRRLLFREPVGLERIQEEYIFKTSDFSYFSTSVFLNGKKHSEVSTFISYSSGEQISYPTMVIERIEYQPIQGGMTQAIITYVGLYSTQTPTPIVNIEPILDRNYLFHRYGAIVRFVQPIGNPGSATEINLITNTYARYTIHTSINGTSIPQGIAPPSTSGVANSVANWNLTWVNCPFNRSNCDEYEDPPGSGIDIQNLTEFGGNIQYFGFSVYGVTMERFGLYGVFRLDIRDQAIYTIAGSIYACGDFPTSTQACYSYLNIPPSANTIPF